MQATTFTFADFKNWFRVKFGSLKADPIMWEKYTAHIEKNKAINNYCDATIKSYNEIKSKLKTFQK